MGFCSVKWCGKSSKTSNYKTDGITFHRFPKNPAFKTKWIEATHRGELWYPCNTGVICSRHFTADNFYRVTSQRRRLLSSAVPTLYLPVLMGRVRKGVRKRGNHTEEDMRTALMLIKSGLSIRHASTQCNLSYATVRRYLTLLKKNEGKPIRLTPNYGVNRVFSAEEEDYLMKYINKAKAQFKGLSVEGFSSRDCRRLAYEMAKIINKKIPQPWVNAKMAGMEWIRSFRDRHQLVFTKRKAGNIIRQTVFDNDDMKAFFGHLKIVKQETANETVTQALPGPSTIATTPTSDTNVSSKEQQDPLSRGTFEQCRFCAEFTKCVSVSNKLYISNDTTIAFNDITVQLDFNDGTLPKTVCRICDAKLKKMYDFVKAVKAAQTSLINVEEQRQVDEIDPSEDYDTLVVKTEHDDDVEKNNDDNDESKDGIVDSLTIGETIFIKEKATWKRKSKAASPKKQKKAKVTEVDNENEDEDEDAELMIDIKEEVIERDTSDLESNTECNVSNTACSVSEIGGSVSEIGGSVSDTRCSVSETGCSVSETGTDAKPSEVELATNALVFEMRSDGSGYGYS